MSSLCSGFSRVSFLCSGASGHAFEALRCYRQNSMPFSGISQHLEKWLVIFGLHIFLPLDCDLLSLQTLHQGEIIFKSGPQKPPSSWLGVWPMILTCFVFPTNSRIRQDYLCSLSVFNDAFEFQGQVSSAHSASARREYPLHLYLVRKTEEMTMKVLVRSWRSWKWFFLLTVPGWWMPCWQLWDELF